jgi:hypothetical protein
LRRGWLQDGSRKVDQLSVLLEGIKESGAVAAELVKVEAEGAITAG